MALTPYSVSPNRFDHSVGPKPIMYWVHLTPKILAGTRCPTSCNAIETITPSTMTSTPTRYIRRFLPRHGPRTQDVPVPTPVPEHAAAPRRPRRALRRDPAGS